MTVASFERWFADGENMPPLAEDMFNTIRLYLPKGATLLECGSGNTTAMLAEYYNVWSIEHNDAYVGKYNSRYRYIKCGISGAFYNMEELAPHLTMQYDALLIDGPDTDRRMIDFLNCYELFDPKVHWFIDDYNLMKEPIEELATKTGRELLRFPKSVKGWAILLGEGK